MNAITKPAAAARHWADARERLINAGLKPESDRPMVTEARDCANAMAAYSDARARSVLDWSGVEAWAKSGRGSSGSGQCRRPLCRIAPRASRLTRWIR